MLRAFAERAAGLTLGVAAACAAPQSPPQVASPPADRSVELDGVAVLAEPDPLTQLDIYDAEKLFHLARESERKERLDHAQRIYELLLEDFPDSGYANPARFNLGLIFEQLKVFEGAAEVYTSIAVQPEPPEGPARRTWLDAHFRLAVAVGELDDWWKAVTVFDYVLALPWLDDFDRLEAMTGRGIAIQEAGEPEAAEVAFSGVLRFYREAERRGRLSDSGLVAEAAFRMGDIARERYSGIQLQFPVDLLRARLETKCEELLSAQYRYLRAVRFGDAHTVAAAGFRIGELYESLYDAVTGLEAPADLTAEQAEVYHEEVRDRVRVLVEKALVAYEKALLIGRRAPTAEDWIGRLEAAIERLKTLFLAETDASPELASDS